MQELLSISPILSARLPITTVVESSNDDEAAAKLANLKHDESNTTTAPTITTSSSSVNYNPYFYDNGSTKTAAAAMAAALHHYQYGGNDGNGSGGSFLINQQPQQQANSGQQFIKSSASSGCLNWRLTPPSSTSSKNTSPSALAVSTHDSNLEYYANHPDACHAFADTNHQLQQQQQQQLYQQEPKSIFSTIYSSNDLIVDNGYNNNNRNNYLFSTINSKPTAAAASSAASFANLQYQRAYSSYYSNPQSIANTGSLYCYDQTDENVEQQGSKRAKHLMFIGSGSASGSTFVNTSPTGGLKLDIKQQQQSNLQQQQQQQQVLSSSSLSNSSSSSSFSSPTTGNVNNSSSVKHEHLLSPKATTTDHSSSVGQSSVNCCSNGTGTLTDLKQQTSTPSSSSASSVSSTSSLTLSNNGTPIVSESFDWMKPAKSQSNGKTRTKDKYRVVYSEPQRVELEKEFLYSKYITIKRKSELSQTLSLSERQIKIWFQNRRAKERKSNRKQKLDNGVTSTTSKTSHHTDRNMKTSDYSDEDDEDGDYDDDNYDEEINVNSSDNNVNCQHNISAGDDGVVHKNEQLRIQLSSLSSSTSSNSSISPISSENKPPKIEKSKPSKKSKAKNNNNNNSQSNSSNVLAPNEEPNYYQPSNCYQSFSTYNPYNQYSSLFGAYQGSETTPNVYQAPTNQATTATGQFYSAAVYPSTSQPIYQSCYPQFQPQPTTTTQTHDYTGTSFFNSSSYVQPSQSTIETSNLHQQQQYLPSTGSSGFANDYLTSRGFISQLNSTKNGGQLLESSATTASTTAPSLLVANVLSQFQPI